VEVEAVSAVSASSPVNRWIFVNFASLLFPDNSASYTGHSAT
jgi:hypothetical protein